MKTLLDIVNEVDNFPYYDDRNPDAYLNFMTSLWRFCYEDEKHCHGYMASSTVNKMPWTARFAHSALQSIILTAPTTDGNNVNASAAITEVVEIARQQKIFPNIRGPCEELYPVLGALTPLNIERDASSLFGIVTRGVHMNIFTRTQEGLKLWIPRRSRTLYMYPGMLDNAVAGGVATGETPLDCIIREAEEEASLPKDLVLKNIYSCGTLSWFNIQDEYLHPGLQFVYDLEVDSDVELKPLDGEVETFHLWGVEQVREAMANAEFKPSCAVVLIDFFIRHGFLTVENEPDYVEIISRTHRKLPFLTKR